MPSFQYRAYDSRGVLARGSIEAVSQDAAGDALWTQGLTPFQVSASSEAGERWWHRDLLGGAGRLRADLITFTREFATLMSAEIPLDDALRILSGQTTSSRMQALVIKLRQDVLGGAMLSDAMQRQSKIFSPDYINIVRAGEIDGTVGPVLKELSDLLERREDVRARIHSALVYPAILIGLSCISLVIIIGVLVPSIAPVFAQGGKPLPSSIQFFVTMQSRWPEILAGLALTAAAVVWLIAIVMRRPGVRLLVDLYKLKAPVVAGFLLQQETARFARTLGTLLRAGVPLLQATTSACGVLQNRHIAAELARAIGLVREGASLHRALQGETSLLPAALQMISVGEEAGKLDQMLLTVASMLEQQTQRQVDRYMTLLTPIITVAIAVLVGSLIMAVMTAILSINEVAVR